ncbi:caspase domain-containing protein [Fomitopsis betulina]|nr:caspase domain-containing protein [Fomitopsis betulina]
MWDPYGYYGYQQSSPTGMVYFPVPIAYYSGSPPWYSPLVPPTPWASQSATNPNQSERQYHLAGQDHSRAVGKTQPDPLRKQRRGGQIVITTSHHHTSHLTARLHKPVHPSHGHSHRHGNHHSHSQSRSRSRTRPEEGASVQQFDRAVASRYAHSRSRALPVPSKCTGRKKALCIGINYTGQRKELHGCVNDARNVRKFLMKNWGFKSENIFVLTDDAAYRHQQPTRGNILDAMRWLVQDASSHDSLVFHYSGHGGQTRDLDGDEVDGLDEVIFPVDYKHAGHIVDDEMHVIMVRDLPNGCRLTALFDSCHSGSALDLPYLYHSDGRVKGLSEVTPSHLREKRTKADVISWSGCADSQTSADTFEGGAAVGAMSYAFIKALGENKGQSYQQLLLRLRVVLKKNHSQKPQLSSSHRINTNHKFIM